MENVMRGSLGFGLLLAIASFGAAGCNGPAGDTREAVPAPDTKQPVFRWQHDTSQRYDLQLSSVLGLGEGQPLVSFQLRGGVLLHVRRLSATSHEFMMSIPDAKFSETSTGKDTDFAALAKELAAPMGFTVEAGRLKTVSVDKGWSSFAASIGRTVAAAFQIPPMDKDAKARTWKTREVDTTGNYEAEYSVASPLTLSKRKLAYQSLKVGQVTFGSLKTNLSPEVVSSNGTLEFSPEGQLKGSRYEEKTNLPMGQAAKVTSTTKLSLALGNGPDKRGLDRKSALANTRQLDATAPYTGPIRADYDQLRIGSYTYETALAEIKKQAEERAKAAAPVATDEEQETAQRELQERAGVFRAMAAILRAHPERIPDAVAEIRRKGRAARTLIDALATANTSESMAALVNLVNDQSLEEDWRGASARGLIRVKQTTPESVQALSSLLDQPRLRVHALYGLGSVARRLEEEGRTTESQAVLQTLLKELRKKQSPTSTAQTLRGISNSGLTSALESVTPFLQAPTEEVRAAAVNTLRLMKDPRVDTLIVQALLTDPKKSVRRAAAEGAALRDPSETLLTGLQNAVTADPDVKVRRQVLDTLIAWLPNHPELKVSLEAVAQKDERPSLKRTAQAALDPKAPASSVN
jgi:HEAT repeat protein